MFSLKKPSDAQIRRFLSSQKDLPFPYPEVGSTRSGIVTGGYNVDHTSVRLGSGSEIFIRAVEAVQHWEMFRIGWLQLLWPDATIEVGSTVGILIRQLGVWSLNASRIVYLIDEESPLRRYGFAYGTLPAHAERGEERFSVEWRDDGSVWYDIYAFSRPNHILTAASYPFTRMLQKRFARDSQRAMLNAAVGRNKDN